MRHQAANDNTPLRLVTKTQAATYCGLSTQTFGSMCPVRAIALGHGVRMERYDLRAIDAWIDSLAAHGEPQRSADQLLAAL